MAFLSCRPVSCVPFSPPPPLVSGICPVGFLLSLCPPGAAFCDWRELGSVWFFFFSTWATHCTCDICQMFHLFPDCTGASAECHTSIWGVALLSSAFCAPFWCCYFISCFALRRRGKYLHLVFLLLHCLWWGWTFLSSRKVLPGWSA